MPFKPVEHPKCPKCGKSVYAAEERVAGGLKWHKTCFKCGLCNKALDSTNCAEHERELYCKVCHGRKFGPKGYGFGGGAGCLSMDQGEHLQAKNEGEFSRGSNAILEPRAIAKAPEGEGCPRCGGYVYAAEQMLARGRRCGSSYHRDRHRDYQGPARQGLSSLRWRRLRRRAGARQGPRVAPEVLQVPRLHQNPGLDHRL
ncbi:PREDICTED: muscle LIM protein Mlp84B-like isoform X3 [Acromyrmex echinatior]|uniref:muscle LIM protein Mlp84B-like isoform X3 n=1 Tax=Acromyrmex echinatior TaxID=103372 RepID=UPI000580F3CC|nr:PREDICTED: muscle LIM protein Mlp84B-like isoform X3 [Acromyrmex echinatior]